MDEVPILPFDPSKHHLFSPSKKSEDGTEKDDEDVCDSSGEIIMADTSGASPTDKYALDNPSLVAMANTSSADDDITTDLGTRNLDSPENNGNLAAMARPSLSAEAADSSVAESSSMVIDTDTDENSFTL